MVHIIQFSCNLFMNFAKVLVLFKCLVTQIGQPFKATNTKTNFIEYRNFHYTLYVHLIIEHIRHQITPLLDSPFKHIFSALQLFLMTFLLMFSHNI